MPALILLLALFVSTITLAGCDSRKKIVVYNWGEYIDDSTIAKFEAKYPEYKVVYRLFDDNEKMYPKIGKDSFDVIVPSDYMVVRLMKEGKLQKPSMDHMPNVAKYLDDSLKGISFDPDKSTSDQVYSYAVPYLFCTVGLLYNTKEVSLPDGTTDPKEIWKVLFDAKNKNKIGMYDSMRESIGAALNYLGYSINSTNETELNAAKSLLIEQRKTVAPIIGIDTLKDKYTSGELVAGVAWSGDYLVCTSALEEAGKDPGMLDFVLPKGSNFAVDMMCIPANAKNVEGAELFINFMYEPEIALANTEYVGFSSPNKEAIAQLPEEIRNNKSFYPDKETFSTLELYYTSDAIDSTYDAIWQQIMAN
jgi:spermidine/putrescine-binding protein